MEMNVSVNEVKDSVEVTKNSKGFGYKIKVYGESENEILAKLLKFEVKLKARYPSQLEQMPILLK